jgi:Flp pilus assembly protein TadD
MWIAAATSLLLSLSALDDCASCRAACSAKHPQYPDEKSLQVAEPVTHGSSEAEKLFIEAKGNDPHFGGTNAIRAAELYKRAVLLDRENASYRNHLAAAMLNAGNGVEALYNQRQAIRLAPEDVRYVINLGYIYHRQGDEQRALLWYMRAAALSPNNVRAHLYAGFALDALGLVDESIVEHERVMALEPSNLKARDALTRLKAPPPPPVLRTNR